MRVFAQQVRVLMGISEIEVEVGDDVLCTFLC